MKNKLLLSLLATLGFVGCSDKNGEIPDIPVYYAPNRENMPIVTQVSNEESKPIKGIRVVFSYDNMRDSLITDTTYTRTDGVAINKLYFLKYPPKNSKYTLEYTDIDGEENGSYQTKKVNGDEIREGKVTLSKKKAE